jgi:hypothetical protein
MSAILASQNLIRARLQARACEATPVATSSLGVSSLTCPAGTVASGVFAGP